MDKGIVCLDSFKVVFFNIIAKIEHAKYPRFHGVVDNALHY